MKTDFRIIFSWVVIIFTVITTDTLYAQTYQVNGTAVDRGNGLVRLTAQSIGNQVGTAWSTTKIDLTQPFDRTFDMFFGCDNGPLGGDGMTFTFHNDPRGLSAAGEGFGYLGYGGAGGITPSIAIEFDTYNGTPDGGLNELVPDHIAIDINGNVNNTTNTFTGLSGPTTVQAIFGGRDLEDCAVNANNYYTIRVVWDPATKTLRLYEEGTLTMTYTNDLVANVFGGNNMVYWGFTAATGTASNEQWIAPSGSIIPWECPAALSCCAPFTLTKSGPTTVCSSPISLGVGAGYVKYLWSTGATTSSINVSAPGTYTVSVIQNQSGSQCPSTATFTIGTSGATASMSGGGTICNDGIATSPVSVALTGTPPWSLTYAIDGVTQTPAITGIATSPYVIAGTGGRTYSLVSLSNGSGCVGGVSGSATINAYPDLPSGNDVHFTAPSTVNLNVANTGGTYRWYTTPTGGTPVFTGPSYTTPTLNATTTYYVENAAISPLTTKSVALLNKSEGTGPNINDMNNGGLPKADLWVNFTANSSFTLQSIACEVNIVLPWSSSRLSLTIQDITAGTSFTKDSLITTALPAGHRFITMPLNYAITAGRQYRISYEGQTAAGALGGSIKGVIYWQLISSYPINWDPEISITGSGVPATRYPGLFDWKISVGSPSYSCGRTPIRAIVDAPLPIELLSFNAELISKGLVHVNWSTVSEISNDRFVIQRSQDGIHFTDIGTVKGAGNSKILRNYQFIDELALDGLSYYRLIQYDEDGKYTYSSIVSVNGAGEKGIIWNIYPNPSENGSAVFIQMNGAGSNEELQLIIYDMAGRELYAATFQCDYSGSIKSELDYFKILSQGSYSVHLISSKQEPLVKKVVRF